MENVMTKSQIYGALGLFFTLCLLVNHLLKEGILMKLESKQRWDIIIKTCSAR